MPLSDDDYNRRSTYFGVFSAAQAARVSELLESLGVRFEFVRQEQDEERLKAWTAWDPAAASPLEGHELFIHSDDLDKVGTTIVDIFPERKFERSNHAMERRADRCAFTCEMTSAPSPSGTCALVRRRSSCPR